MSTSARGGLDRRIARRSRGARARAGEGARSGGYDHDGQGRCAETATESERFDERDRLRRERVRPQPRRADDARGCDQHGRKLALHHGTIITRPQDGIQRDYPRAGC